MSDLIVQCLLGEEMADWDPVWEKPKTYLFSSRTPLFYSVMWRDSRRTIMSLKYKVGLRIRAVRCDTLSAVYEKIIGKARRFEAIPIEGTCKMRLLVINVM